MKDDVKPEWFTVPHRDLARIPWQAKRLTVIVYGQFLTQADGEMEDGRSLYVRYRAGSIQIKIEGDQVFCRPWPGGHAVAEDVLREALEGVLTWPSK